MDGWMDGQAYKASPLFVHLRHFQITHKNTHTRAGIHRNINIRKGPDTTM
jgi:hypothetical protein